MSKAKKAKPVKAWAIVNKRGSLILFDYRLPITWLRSTGLRDLLKYRGERLARVEIREL
jgi:hypothetical protein